jgi:hypothetical protein
MPHSKVNLVLVSARKSRGSDYWGGDDYDVRVGDGRAIASFPGTGVLSKEAYDPARIYAA